MRNDLNKRLATALGWTNLTDAGGAVLGSPPWAIPNARGQCQVPDWEGKWEHCGPLLAKYQIDMEQNKRSVIASHDCHRTLCRQMIAIEAERDMQTRHAIVDAVCAKLEAAA